jgi:filamentous hemagglutinin
MTRLANEPKISGSSSFYDRATAENAVSQALDAHQTTISDWLNGTSGRLRIDYTLPDPVGISVSRGATSAVDVNSSRIILVRDPSMRTGYKILTGFPTK